MDWTHDTTGNLECTVVRLTITLGRVSDRCKGHRYVLNRPRTHSNRVNFSNLMPWTSLSFGRYAGMSLPQIVMTDCDYFFWGYSAGAFDNPATLLTQADEVYRKARAIRIPQTGTELLVAEYAVHPAIGKFSGVAVVPASRPKHEGITATFRLPVFDLSVPRGISAYDKSGGKQLVKALKFYVFGDPDCRLTKQLCEEFFEIDANFVL